MRGVSSCAWRHRTPPSLLSSSSSSSLRAKKRVRVLHPVYHGNLLRHRRAPPGHKVGEVLLHLPPRPRVEAGAVQPQRGLQLVQMELFIADGNDDNNKKETTKRSGVQTKGDGWFSTVDSNTARRGDGRRVVLGSELSSVGEAFSRLPLCN